MQRWILILLFFFSSCRPALGKTPDLAREGPVIVNAAARNGCAGDELAFPAERYCPAETDPEGHTNRKRNVRFYFIKFSKKGA